MLQVLKGPSTDSLVHKLTFSGLQHRGSSLKSTRDLRGETELTSFRARARRAEAGTALSRSRGAGGCHYSFVEPPPTQPAQYRQLPNLSSPLTWLIPLVTPPNFQSLLHTSSLPWLILQTFLKFLKGPQILNKQWLALL